MQIRTKINRQTLDEGIETVLWSIYAGAAIDSTILCLAVEHGHTSIAKILLACGLSKEAALAHSKGQYQIAHKLHYLTIDEDTIRATLYWAIKNYQTRYGLKLLDRLTKVIKATDPALANYTKTKMMTGFVELAAYLNFEPVVKILKAMLPPPRRDTLIRTAGYWAAKHDNERMFEYVCADQYEAALTLHQLSQDKLIKEFDKNLNSEFVRYREITSETIAAQYGEEKENKSHTNPTVNQAYELASKAKKEMLDPYYSSENYIELVKLALLNNNFVALVVLDGCYGRFNQPFILNALKQNEMPTLINFILIGNDSDALDICILLREHQHRDARNKFISTYWSLAGVLHALINRNLNLTTAMSQADADLFNHLEKPDALVKRVLDRCLQDRFAEKISPEELIQYHTRFDILPYCGARKESKREGKTTTGFPGNLPGIAWKKITGEYICGQKFKELKKNKEDKEDKEDKLEGKIEIKIDNKTPIRLVYKNIDNPQFINRSFYLLLASPTLKPDLNKPRAEHKQLTDFRDVLQREYNAKGSCSYRVWPTKWIASVLLVIGVEAANSYCLVSLVGKKRQVKDMLQSIAMPSYNQTCFDAYYEGGKVGCHNPYNISIVDVCVEGCRLSKKYDDLVAGSGIVLGVGIVGLLFISLITGYRLCDVTFRQGRERFDSHPISGFSLAVQEKIPRLGRYQYLAEDKTTVGETKRLIAAAINHKDKHIRSSAAVCGLFPTVPVKAETAVVVHESKREVQMVVEERGMVNADEVNNHTPLLGVRPSRCPCVIL